ncbi:MULTISPECIES: hypothetical protein [Peribacillus]|uniref:hypothetical protein n=1 Tax=Peribacillus TaxID=2675229 RepID=UPI000BA78476|nr:MULTISPECIES: hypothetical protein [Peribacillus]MCY9139690.1 hypothetical protein [Peribacillus frigoritolerans]PAK34481.1 hypothetical protein CHI08_25505 [Peribacillus simplex]
MNLGDKSFKELRRMLSNLEYALDNLSNIPQNEMNTILKKDKEEIFELWCEVSNEIDRRKN